VTASLKAYRDCAGGVDADERHVASVRLQVRACLLERLLDAGFEAVGVKSIEQEKAANKRVPPESIDADLSRCIFVNDFQHSLDARSVKLHQSLDEILRHRGHCRVIRFFNSLKQCFDRLQLVLCVARSGHGYLSLYLL